MMNKLDVPLILLFLFFPIITPAAVIHVPGDQPTIQAGIDAASDGDTVLVADGTYTGDGNRDMDFGAKAIIVRSENGPDSCIIDCEGSSLEPHRGFYFHSGEDENSVVQGFTIQHGYAAGQTSIDDSGGGIHCVEASPSIMNNKIVNNTAEGGGAGFFCYGVSSPKVINNIISDNTADYSGAGILCHFYSSPVILNNTISGNLSKIYGGGGICCKNTTSPKIMNNIITGNTAEDYGGAIRSSHCFSTIRNNIISGNHAGYHGGGIFYWYTSRMISHNTITGNTAGEDGGGIYCFESSPAISNNRITHNTVEGRGGGIYCNSSSSPYIIYNTMTGNASLDEGGGISCFDRSFPTITNSILWNNAPDEIYVPSNVLTVIYCDVQGGYPGEGNMDEDPLFVSGPLGNYYLSQTATGHVAESPCVNAGDSRGEMIYGTTRTDGKQDSGIADMGFHYLTPGGVVGGPGPAYTNPPQVRVFPSEQNGAYIHTFSAYGPQHYGVNVSCWDGDGDGFDEILTGPGPGAVFGPHVKGYRVNGAPITGLSFLAYGTHRYGVHVTAGDLDGDAFDEIITGAGPGAVFGPHVRAFRYNENGTPSVIPEPGVNFMAYGTRQWGVHVAGGDIDHDGFDEIITGAGPGPVFGPHVRGWNVDGSPATAIQRVSFFAYNTRRYGVRITGGDVDGDGTEEIVAAPGPSENFGAHIGGWNFDGVTVSPLPGFSFFAWPSSRVRFGARVFAGADLDGDGTDDLVVGAGPDPSVGSPIKIYHYEGVAVIEWLSLQAFPPARTHGVSVAAGRF